MPYLKINGIKMAVETFGDMDKPALILLQGGVCGAIGRHYWEGFDMVGRLSQDLFVITFDRRGHGYTPFSGTFDDTVSDIIAVMDTLCIPKAFVAGGSLGTYIGGRAAILYPDRLSGLILIAPHTHAEGKTPANQWAERNNIPLERMTDVNDPELKALQDFATWGPNPTQTAKDEFNGLWEKYSYIPPLSPEETQKAYQAMGWFDNREGYKTLTVPTLIFGGKYDGFCPVEEARSIHEWVKGSRYIEFEDGGHNLPFTHTDEIIAAIKEFCASVG